MDVVKNDILFCMKNLSEEKMHLRFWPFEIKEETLKFK